MYYNHHFPTFVLVIWRIDLPKGLTRFPPATRAYLALVFGMLSLGFSAIFVRGANAPGTVTAFYRMAIGAGLMALPFVRQYRQNAASRPNRASVRLAVLGGFFFALDLIFWTTGIDMSGATIPTLMSNTAPLWVGLGAWLLFRERQDRRFWIGLLIAISGAVIILGQDFSKASNVGLGSLLGLVSAIFYGAYYLVTQRARSGMRTLTYFWIATLSAAVFLMAANILLGCSFLGYDRFTYLMFLGIGVLVQAMGWMAINYAQGLLPAAIVAPTLLGQPVITALLAWPLFGEMLNSWQFFGGAAVITGVYYVHRSRTNGSKE